MTEVAFHAIHEALLARGFQQEDTIRPVTYSGSLRVGSESIAVLVAFPDFELQHLPIIRLRERPTWIPDTCNHIVGSNVICYATSGLAFIDRYDAHRQVLYCLDCATTTLNDIRDGNVLGDVDQEFGYYWRGEPLLVDAERYESPQTLDVALLSLVDRRVELLIDREQDALKKYAAYSPTKKALQTAFLIPSAQTPPADALHWPPNTLQELLHWLSSHSPELARSLRETLQGLNGLRVHRTLLVFQAEPTWFGVSFRVPWSIGQAKFRNANRFVDLIEKQSGRIKIDRYMPIRVDSEYLVRRNLRHDEESLLGKRVVLAGCGTIGGHLGHALARAGAGFGSGTLFLVDPDYLTPGNLGRHRRGFDGLLEPKATDAAADLQRSLPGLDVRPVVGSVLDLDLQEFDLIVDATGEEQLSEALNARFVAGESAPVIFAWIVGNGLAVQSFTLSSTKLGCLRCWKSPGSVSAFSPAGDNRSEIRIGRGCDDAFLPFNGSSALLAAGLAFQAVVDWASGRPEPTLRTIQVNYEATRYVSPESPGKSLGCQACGRTDRANKAMAIGDARRSVRTESRQADLAATLAKCRATVLRFLRRFVPGH